MVERDGLPMSSWGRHRPVSFWVCPFIRLFGAEKQLGDLGC